MKFNNPDLPGLNQRWLRAAGHQIGLCFRRGLSTTVRMDSRTFMLVFLGVVCACFGCLQIIGSKSGPPNSKQTAIFVAQPKFNVLAEKCRLNGLAESLAPFGVQLTITEDQGACALILDWPSPPERPRECLEQLMLVDALTEHYRVRSGLVRSLRPSGVSCRFSATASSVEEARVAAKPHSTDSIQDPLGAENILVDSGEGHETYDKMTYNTYESMVRITPRHSMIVSSIQPLIIGCAGRCEFYSTIFHPNGFVLGTAQWSWVSTGRKPLVDDLRGKVIAKFDPPVYLQGNVSYLMLTVASAHPELGVEGGSVYVQTAGLEVGSRSPLGALIFPVGPVNWAGAAPSMISRRGPLSFKLLGRATE